MFKSGTSVCSQKVVRALMVFADIVAKSAGDTRRSVCQESFNETFAVFYPYEFNGVRQYYCTGTGADGKGMGPDIIVQTKQDTSKSFCVASYY